MQISLVLVTGGTGTLGRLVVARLGDIGRDVRVLSRRCHESADGIEYVTGDLLTGDGIDSAVDGAGTILHLAGGPKGDDEATRNLARAASRAGAKHLVYISVIEEFLAVAGVTRTTASVKRLTGDRRSATGAGVNTVRRPAGIGAISLLSRAPRTARFSRPARRPAQHHNQEQRCAY